MGCPISGLGAEIFLQIN